MVIVLKRVYGVNQLLFFGNPKLIFSFSWLKCLPNWYPATSNLVAFFAYNNGGIAGVHQKNANCMIMSTYSFRTLVKLVRPPRLVSYAFLYTTDASIFPQNADNFQYFSEKQRSTTLFFQETLVNAAIF